jgi:hypothetical protein
VHEASVRTAVATLQTVGLGTVHTTSQGQTITTPAIASTAAVATETLVLVQRTERRHRSAGRSAARGMQLGNILRMGSMAHVELSMRRRCNLEVCLLAPLTAPRRDPSDFHDRNVMTLCVCSQRPPPQPRRRAPTAKGTAMRWARTAADLVLPALHPLPVRKMLHLSPSPQNIAAQNLPRPP